MCGFLFRHRILCFKRRSWIHNSASVMLAHDEAKEGEAEEEEEEEGDELLALSPEP